MLHRMLGEVVVPGDPIMFEELEQLVPILREPLSELDRRNGFASGSDDLIVEAIDVTPVSRQVLLPQPMLVDRRDDGSEELAELEGQPLKLVVERVMQQGSVQIPDEVDQALLLEAA